MPLLSLRVTPHLDTVLSQGLLQPPDGSAAPWCDRKVQWHCSPRWIGEHKLYSSHSGQSPSWRRAGTGGARGCRSNQLGSRPLPEEQGQRSGQHVWQLMAVILKEKYQMHKIAFNPKIATHCEIYHKWIHLTATHHHCSATEHKDGGNDLLQSHRAKHPDNSRKTTGRNC